MVAKIPAHLIIHHIIGTCTRYVQAPKLAQKFLKVPLLILNHLWRENLTSCPKVHIEVKMEFPKIRYYSLSICLFQEWWIITTPKHVFKVWDCRLCGCIKLCRSEHNLKYKTLKKRVFSSVAIHWTYEILHKTQSMSTSMNSNRNTSFDKSFNSWNCSI